jgi:hypothetical protein
MATSLLLPMDAAMLFGTEAECNTRFRELYDSVNLYDGNPWGMTHGEMFKCAGDENTYWKYYERPRVRRGFSQRAFFDSWGGMNNAAVSPKDCSSLPQGPVMTPNFNALPSPTCPKVSGMYVGCGPGRFDPAYNCCDPTRMGCSPYPSATPC